MTVALAWLAAEAHALDRGSADEELLLPRLGDAGVFHAGVPVEFGGAGGDVRDAINVISNIAEYSLTAALVAWGQRTQIEYFLQSPNHGLRERWFPTFLNGTHAGATGLSNAMKFLGGIEKLQIEASPLNEGWRLDGKLPWVTNLRKNGFVVAAAVELPGAQPFVAALPHDKAGLVRSDDLELLALRGSNTAAITVEDVAITTDDIIHSDARSYLPRVRPAFLGLQCGLSIGLARASLNAAREQGAQTRLALASRIDAVERELGDAVQVLHDGLATNRFIGDAISLFRIRIHLAEIVHAAVALELEASGGRAYLLEHNADFSRRWNEAAFIPVVTPSLSQLHGELQKHAAKTAESVAA